jgi:hypothetical protein
MGHPFTSFSGLLVVSGLASWVDSGELEDGAQVAPVAAFGACDRGLDSLEFVFF